MAMGVMWRLRCSFTVKSENRLSTFSEWVLQAQLGDYCKVQKLIFSFVCCFIIFSLTLDIVHSQRSQASSWGAVTDFSELELGLGTDPNSKIAGDISTETSYLSQHFFPRNTRVWQLVSKWEKNVLQGNLSFFQSHPTNVIPTAEEQSKLIPMCLQADMNFALQQCEDVSVFEE